MILDIPDLLLTRVRQVTAADTTMQKLRQTIITGWPEKKAQVDNDFDFAETLGISDGILLKGERIIIPQSLRK
jgi:hypothetical protein